MLAEALPRKTSAIVLGPGLGEFSEKDCDFILDWFSKGLSEEKAIFSISTIFCWFATISDLLLLGFKGTIKLKDSFICEKSYLSSIDNRCNKILKFKVVGYPLKPSFLHSEGLEVLATLIVWTP